MGLSAVYLASTIRTFALSLLGIFTPLYIYQILESTQTFTTRTAALLGVVGYYIILRLTILLTDIPISYFIAEVKGGFRKSMLISNCLRAINLLLLIFAKDQPGLLLPAAIIGGALIPFYWIPYHLSFIEDGKGKRFGKKISTVGVLNKVSFWAQLECINTPDGGGLFHWGRYFDTWVFKIRHFLAPCRGVEYQSIYLYGQETVFLFAPCFLRVFSDCLDSRPRKWSILIQNRHE